MAQPSDAEPPEPPERAGESSILLEQARSGSRNALQALLVMHMGPLRAFVRLQVSPLLRTRESESDVVQQVCVEVLQRAEKFEFQGESKFRGWLYGAVLNVIRDQERFHKAQRRTPAREQAISDPDLLLASYRSVSSPSGRLAANEEARQLEHAFGRLPAHYAEVLALTHVAGLTRTEIAAQLQTTAAAVSKLQRRAMLRLSKELRLHR